MNWRKDEDGAVRFAHLGLGNGEGDLELQADAMGNVRRLGYVPLERQVALLRGSRLLLFLSQYEGFGIPAVEAMAAGTPAIVSNSAALPEIVGDAGLLVNASEPEAVLEIGLSIRTRRILFGAISSSEAAGGPRSYAGITVSSGW